MVQYTSRGIAYPEATDSVQVESRDFEAMANTATSAIDTGVAEAIEAWATKDATTGRDANTLTTEGTWGSVSGATIANRPPGTEAGILETRHLSSAGSQPKIQVWTSFGGDPQMWTRFYGTSWSAWTRTDGTNALRNSGFLGVDGSLDEADTPGAYGYWATDANAPGASSGVVYVARVNNDNNVVQFAVEYGSQPGMYTRFRGSTWSGWTRLDVGGLPSGGGTESSPTALKTAPVALAASAGNSTEAVVAGAIRFPVTLNAPITRWRLHIRNHNDRMGTSYTGGANFTGIWVGPRSTADNGAAFASTPTRVATAFSLPAGGEDFATQWNSTPIGDGADMLISLGWTGATGPNTQAASGCYRSTDFNDAYTTSGAGLTRDAWAPFTWWIEVETLATTPIVAAWGDSITTGTGNTLILHDSFLSQYARRIGAIPVHHSFPGTGMIAWTNANTHQWTRWQPLTRVDAVIHFMGQNDAFGSLAEMQSRFNNTIENLKTHVSGNVYLATLTPHAGKTSAQNDVRKAYNNWLKTLPGGARDCFDFSAAVANAANDAILPEYTSDTLHLTTLGSTQVADAITRPITTTSSDSATDALAAYLNEIN